MHLHVVGLLVEGHGILSGLIVIHTYGRHVVGNAGLIIVRQLVGHVVSARIGHYRCLHAVNLYVDSHACYTGTIVKSHVTL